MDKDRIQGAGKQVKGTVKQAIGKVTGNRQAEVEGAAQKMAGKVQGKIGKAKDAVRDTQKIDDGRRGHALASLTQSRTQ